LLEFLQETRLKSKPFQPLVDFSKVSGLKSFGQKPKFR